MDFVVELVVDYLLCYLCIVCFYILGSLLRMDFS